MQVSKELALHTAYLNPLSIEPGIIPEYNPQSGMPPKIK